jgi:hypothetical protein
MKPFSDNVVFVDTEFSSLDPYVGEILSIGLVKPNGEELYLELEYDGNVNDWVRENILPTLTEPKVSREEARRIIREFVGDGEPYMVANVGQFDTIYIYKLFGVGGEPFYWLPVDLASILFAAGIDPESWDIEGEDGLCHRLGLDIGNYRRHHALDDARLLADIYKRLAEDDRLP